MNIKLKSNINNVIKESKKEWSEVDRSELDEERRK